jgi:hypothetical protein
VLGSARFPVGLKETFGRDDAALTVPPGIAESWFICARLTARVVGMLGDGGGGGPMREQPELPRDSFTLGHSLITRMRLTRTADETGRAHGPHIELAQVVRQLNTKVAPVALFVIYDSVVAAHADIVPADCF